MSLPRKHEPDEWPPDILVVSGGRSFVQKGREMRVLSGIQPSGHLHLGNYFGAIEQQIKLQDNPEAEICMFFIADFHALTSCRYSEHLRQHTKEVAATYLALGLDPDKAVLFRQSDVPETTELAWILGCSAGMGQFLNAHAYKDKVEQGLTANMGLFSYPLLMAADILLYKATHVPVGQDQVQHIEIARNVARSFNAHYGQILVKPEPVLSEAPYVPGTDGRKMSKSYGNTIAIFHESEKALKKDVNSIVTDSKNPEVDKFDHATCNAFAIYKLFASEEDARIMRWSYSHAPEMASFTGYGVVKKAIMERMKLKFGKASKRYYELVKSKELEDILNEGAKIAKTMADDTIREVRKAVGLR